MPNAGAPPPGVQTGLDRVPCGYLATDASGVILEINETLLEWLGYETHELVGRKSFTDLLTGGGRIFHETHYRPTLELHGEAREIAVDLRESGGGRLPVLLNSVLERSGSAETATVRTAVFKATERRRYERELLLARERAEASEAEALSIARTLQTTLIPTAPASIGGIDLQVAFHPAGDGALIGGDFYDIFELASGDWIVVIGDVCGKGVEAAALAARVRRVLRAEAVHCPPLDELLMAVNHSMLDSQVDRYCTLLVVRVSGSGPVRQASVCAGGHPLPMLRTSSGPPVEVGRHGSLVGVFRDAHYQQADLELGAGDLLLLYTDGVTEGRSGSELFGEERVRAAVAAGHPSELAGILVDQVMAFQGGFAADDLAVITLAMPAD